MQLTTLVLIASKSRPGIAAGCHGRLLRRIPPADSPPDRRPSGHLAEDLPSDPAHKIGFQTDCE